ncbi:MAG TPA: methyltransferase, partial [Rhodospirillales bacterium]|nr:methyltransferase [Rhodospirillales bacterium]
DVAAGCGVAAIAAARAGAAIAAARAGADATANDIDPLALRAIALNAALNGVAVAVSQDDLLDAPPADGGEPGRRVVLAGDVCYQRPMAERCIAWLRRHAAAGSEVLLADPGRSYLPTTGLIPLARYAVPTSRDLEDREIRECTVWRVQP